MVLSGILQGIFDNLYNLLIFLLRINAIGFWGNYSEVGVNYWIQLFTPRVSPTRPNLQVPGQMLLNITATPTNGMSNGSPIFSFAPGTIVLSSGTYFLSIIGNLGGVFTGSLTTLSRKPLWYWELRNTTFGFNGNPGATNENSGMQYLLITYMLVFFYPQNVPGFWFTMDNITYPGISELLFSLEGNMTGINLFFFSKD